MFSTLLEELVHADPLAAARFAETNSIGYTHDQILHRVAQLWAATDSSAGPRHFMIHGTNKPPESGVPEQNR